MKRTPHFLFVCSGNLHRSVMAAALTEAMLQQAKLRASIGSAGTLGLTGQPAPEEVHTVCSEFGLDVSEHRNRPISKTLVERADRIIVMEDQHGDVVMGLSPRMEDHIIYLGDYLPTPGDVPDPIGKPLEKFRETRDMILGALQRLFPELAPLLPQEIE